jgi:predicted transcriptional regulator
MSRVCTVCSHEDRFDIDTILVDRSASYRDIAERFALSKTAVSRHVTGGHISELLSLADDAERSAQADTLLDRIEDLQARTLAILESTEETREHGTALSAIREARRNLELIGEVTKELNRTPTLNLHLNAEWIELRTAIVEALEPHLEARESVLRAIERAGNDRGH